MTNIISIDYRNIIEYCDRPFSNVEEMNKGLIANWNSVVKPSDTVYSLGDFAMGSGTNKESIREILRRLNGEKIIILGNHDDKTLARWAQDYREDESLDVDFIAGSTTYQLKNGHKILLCHFPYTTDDRHKTRYANRHPEDQGSWLLHGHTHSKDIFSDHPRQIHVGVDAHNYTPVSEETLLELMRMDRPGQAL